MVNDIACQKQEAPNQKCQLELSKRNLLLLMKILRSFIKLTN